MSNFNFNMSRNSGKGQGCLIFFGMPFFGAGAAMLWFLFFSPLLQTYESESWIETDCQILSSSLKSSRSDDGYTYRPQIKYKYHFDNQSYESSRLDFAGDMSSSDRKGENKYVEKYPAGSTQKCFVNPENPSEAVLVKDWGRGMFKWIILPFGGVFFCVGLGIMLFGASPWLFKKKAPQREMGGAVTLKPTGQRMGKLAGALFINIFWNGIVSVFAIFWIGGLINGTAEGFFMKWGMGLFLSPFFAIGAFLFWNFLKEIKNMFAPKISITLRQGLSWTCGKTADIRWDIPYNAQIDELQLDFVCTESATYRRGTNTSTDTETVAVIPISVNKSMNFTGNCKFEIPEGLMPSFQSNNNSIQWAIRVRSIGPGPDADDLYNIQLYQS